MLFVQDGSVGSNPNPMIVVVQVGIPGMRHDGDGPVCMSGPDLNCHFLCRIPISVSILSYYATSHVTPVLQGENGVAAKEVFPLPLYQPFSLSLTLNVTGILTVFLAVTLIERLNSGKDASQLSVTHIQHMHLIINFYLN